MICVCKNNFFSLLKVDTSPLVAWIKQFGVCPCASLINSEICKPKTVFIRLRRKRASSQLLTQFLGRLQVIFPISASSSWVTVLDFGEGRLSPCCHRWEVYLLSYHILSVGGGGTLTTRVPDSSCTSTVSSRGVLDISSNFFLMNSFSVALWKYLDLAILSTNLKIFFPVFPPPALRREEDDSRGCDCTVQKWNANVKQKKQNKKKPCERQAIWSAMSAPSISCSGGNEPSQRRWVEVTPDGVTKKGHSSYSAFWGTLPTILKRRQKMAWYEQHVPVSRWRGSLLPHRALRLSRGRRLILVRRGGAGGLLIAVSQHVQNRSGGDGDRERRQHSKTNQKKDQALMTVPPSFISSTYADS